MGTLSLAPTQPVRTEMASDAGQPLLAALWVAQAVGIAVGEVECFLDEVFGATFWTAAG